MIHVIGVGMEGPEGLSENSRSVIGGASVVIGSERHLKNIDYVPEEKKHSLKADLFKMVDIIKDHQEKGVGVVLASGDPNLFGITNYLLKHFGKESIEITPAVSSMQWAFALAKEPWSDAEIVSAHGSRSVDDVVRAVLMRDKVGVFTDDKRSPDSIAAALIKAGISDRTVIVCENIGTDSAKVTECPLGEAAVMRFSPMNVMIIKRDDGMEAGGVEPPRTIGIPDYQFAQREGLITKSEVRAIALSKLRPSRGDIVWDVGAGCGSVAIEAERLAYPGHVYAVEKDKKQLGFIKKNIEKFRTPGVEMIDGEAPAALESLPDPSAIFVGGSGGKLMEILDACDARLVSGGRLVLNIVTLENLSDALEFMKDSGYIFEITSVSVSRSKSLGEKHFMVAANPVHIVLGVKK